jgi:hypothetical protein
MLYTKPQVLNVKRASQVILGGKIGPVGDNLTTGSSTVSAYRSDE